MKVAIIGGGLTGLSAAYELTRRGHTVTIFESSSKLGGLANGFKENNWSWSLEYSYHHWFTNDNAVLQLTEKLGLGNKRIIKRPITANLYNGKTYQLDSPMSLLRFPLLPLVDKLRTAAILGYLKITPFWKPLENITAEQLLTSIGGRHSYAMLWEPLLVGKFGTYAPTVQAAWFWARIKKRTSKLMYMEGGFRILIDALEKAITRQGGKIERNKKISAMKHVQGFDKTLWTGPTPDSPIPHLWAQTLILETKEPILKDIYWLNVTDRSFPFLAAVAHTNFVNKKYYGGNHITYFGNYLPEGHPYLSMTKDQLLKKFMPFIKRLSLNSTFSPQNSFLYTVPNAQPVHELHYSSRAPKFHTTIPNVYLTNMDSVFPWDRGTNYAIELGMKAAQNIISS